MTQPEQNPLFVFHDFENTPATDDGLGLSEWPLHFTVTPFFTLEQADPQEALDLITIIAEEALPIEVVAGEQAMYGPNNDIPVTKLIDTSGELHHFHNELIRRLGDIGCRFSDLTYGRENYSPHVSHKPGSVILSDAGYVARSMSVATKRADTPKPNKIILKRIEL